MEVKRAITLFLIIGLLMSIGSLLLIYETLPRISFPLNFLSFEVILFIFLVFVFIVGIHIVIVALISLRSK
mgnify:CR=1 FL=1